MRMLFWCVLIGTFGCLTGCGEFVRSDQQSAAVTADVVGDTADARIDSTKQPDVFGSGGPSNDAAESMFDSSLSPPADLPDREESEFSVSDTDDPDIAGSLGTAPLDPLKTTSRKPNEAK